METITVGGAMSGNCAIGSSLIPSTPKNKRTMEMTIARAGLWRTLANMVAPRARTLATHWRFSKPATNWRISGNGSFSSEKPTERKWKGDASQNSQVLQHQRHSRILLIRRVVEVSRNTFSFCDVICDENPDRTATI